MSSKFIACSVFGSLLAVSGVWPTVAFSQYRYGYNTGVYDVAESQINHQLPAAEKTLESAHKELSQAGQQLQKNVPGSAS